MGRVGCWVGWVVVGVALVVWSGKLRELARSVDLFQPWQLVLGTALRLSAQSEQSFASAKLSALTDLEAQNGIDTDQEMQDLLVIEKNYAANAKVIQAVADMIDTLIRLDG